MTSSADPAEQLKNRIVHSAPNGYRHVETAVVHRGPEICKTATMWLTIGENGTEKLVLMVNSWTPRPDGSGFDLRPGASQWACENEAIGALHRFLSARFGVPEQNASLASAIRLARSGESGAGRSA